MVNEENRVNDASRLMSDRCRILCSVDCQVEIAREAVFAGLGLPSASATYTRSGAFIIGEEGSDGYSARRLSPALDDQMTAAKRSR